MDILTHNSSLTLPLFSSSRTFILSSFWIFRSFLLTVRWSFSHISRVFLPSSVSVTDKASILNRMSRFPRSRSGLLWSITQARMASSSACCGLYFVRLLNAPVIRQQSSSAIIRSGDTHARSYSPWTPKAARSHTRQHLEIRQFYPCRQPPEPAPALPPASPSASASL
jgi:hypothetical protein